ncbi:restriction endonuclease subunit S [Micromonospora sp. WMMA1923]|uniref:restriction endonuclease subunit S n=1 Tax=Micromonospora sp. WMMA1923 TaxID=3404125 RepID=UPI003B9461FE
MTATLELSKLADVASINPRLVVRPEAEELISFIPMSAVDAVTGATDSCQDRPFAEVSKGYTLFADGDVLVAKITPCFENGKIAQARLARSVGVGSTEFHVIRPKSARLDARYLLHFLRRPAVKLAGERRMTGSAGQRRVPESYLANLAIPMPSMDEQRRIAKVLDRSNELRIKRREALVHLDDLAQSIFLDIFGDPVANPKEWPVAAMSTLFDKPPTYGTMIPASALGGSWLCLRVANIQDWKIDLSDRKYVDLEGSGLNRHVVKDGDVLLARAIASQEHLGKAVVAHPGKGQWAFDSHLMRLSFDARRANPEYICAFFRSSGGRSLFLRVTRRSSVQFNINTKEISKLCLPVPPVAQQNEFAGRMQEVEDLRAAHRGALAELDALFASLQDRAFRGLL